MLLDIYLIQHISQKFYENQGIKYKNTILHLYAVGQINNLDFRIFIAKMLISSALGLRNGNVF